MEFKVFIMRKNNFYLLLTSCAAIAYLASTPLYASTSEDPMVGAASSRMGSPATKLDARRAFQEKEGHLNKLQTTCASEIAEYADVSSKKATAERNQISAEARIREEFIRTRASSEAQANELRGLSAAIKNDQDTSAAKQKFIDEAQVENLRVQLERIQLYLAETEEMISRSKLPISYDEARDSSDVLKERKAELERKMNLVSDYTINNLSRKLENTRFEKLGELYDKFMSSLRLSEREFNETLWNDAEFQAEIGYVAFHRQTLLQIHARFEDEIRKLKQNIAELEEDLFRIMGFGS